MMHIALRRTALSLLLATCAASASAHWQTQPSKPVVPSVTSTQTVNGIDFTSTVTGNKLVLDIDAANPAGGASKAVYLNALSLGNIGSYTGVSVTGSNAISNGWTATSQSLSASGCKGGPNSATTGKGSGKTTTYSSLCLDGFLPVFLDDDMTFTFYFNGDVNLTSPNLNFSLLDKWFQPLSLTSVTFPAKDTGSANGGGNATVPPVTQPPVTQPPVTQPPVTPTTPDQPAPQPQPVPPDVIPPADIEPTLPVDTLPVGQPAPGGDGSSEVPEPQSILLMAGGLGLLAMLRRRQARR